MSATPSPNAPASTPVTEASAPAEAGLHPADRARGPGQRPAPRDPHPLPARAQRLPAHRPRQGDLPGLRHRGRVRRRLQPAPGRHQPGEGRPRIRARHPGRRALARFRVARPAPRLGLLPGAVPGRRETHPPGRCVRVRPHRRTGPRIPRHADRAGPQLAVPQPLRRREPRPVPPHACRRVRRRRAHAARQDRHGQRQHEPARPRAVPHQARRAPEHRPRMADLPDVRLRAFAQRRGRGHHALAVHAGVRGPPPAVRLVRGQGGPGRTRRTCSRRCLPKASPTRPASRARSSSRA